MCWGGSRSCEWAKIQQRCIKELSHRKGRAEVGEHDFEVSSDSQGL